MTVVMLVRDVKCSMNGNNENYFHNSYQVKLLTCLCIYNQIKMSIQTALLTVPRLRITVSSNCVVPSTVMSLAWTVLPSLAPVPVTVTFFLSISRLENFRKSFFGQIAPECVRRNIPSTNIGKTYPFIVQLDTIRSCDNIAWLGHFAPLLHQLISTNKLNVATRIF